MTIRDALHRIIAVTTPAEADALLAELVADASLHNPEKTNEELVEFTKSNIGYLIGYYDTTTIQRVHRLFQVSHPLFGNIGEAA